MSAYPASAVEADPDSQSPASDVPAWSAYTDPAERPPARAPATSQVLVGARPGQASPPFPQGMPPATAPTLVPPPGARTPGTSSQGPPGTFGDLALGLAPPVAMASAPPGSSMAVPPTLTTVPPGSPMAPPLAPAMKSAP